MLETFDQSSIQHLGKSDVAHARRLCRIGRGNHHLAKMQAARIIREFFSVKTPSPWSKMNLLREFVRRSTIAVNPLTSAVAIPVVILTVPACFGAEIRMAPLLRS